MRQTISFIILRSTGSSVCHFTIPRLWIGLGLLAVVGLAVAAGFAGRDYMRLRQAADTRDQLETACIGQQEEIRDQRLRIQQFAKEIDGLKDRLVALNQFEKKVRIIANLEVDNDSDSLFGVGGDMMEDLNTRIDLEAQHDDLVREVHQQSEMLQQMAAMQNQSFEQLLDAMQDKLNILSATPAVRPAKGWVTSCLGPRKSPFTGLKEFHSGMDIANREGEPVIATGDGVVTFAGKKGFLGKMLVIDHGHGMVTRYGHMSEVRSKRGETVKRGEVIGAIGATGRSTGPHLHYEVLLNGVPVNPERYILN